MSDISGTIQTITIWAIPVIFAITLHEAAHGYVAKYFGDSTAYLQGRVTLNPLKHVDPIGTIVMPLVLALLPFGFIFGYAKPVPVNFANLRDPKRDMIWVALAGPAVNLVQALVWVVAKVSVSCSGRSTAGASRWACCRSSRRSRTAGSSRTASSSCSRWSRPAS